MPVNVFIVEDHPRQLAAMKAKVDTLGYRIAGTSTTSKEALAQLAHTHADVALVDIHLHHAPDGIALARSIQQRHQIPVIFITSMSADDIVATAIDTGPASYLLKPVEPAELKANIELAVRSKQATAPPTAAANPPLDYITVRLGRKLQKIHFKDVSHLVVEAKNYVTLVDTTRRKASVRGSLTQLLSTVFPPAFVRTHTSYSINLAFVASIDEPTQTIELATGEHIPIGGRYKKTVYQRLNIA